MKNTKCTDNYNEASGVEISDKVDEAKKYVNKLFVVDLVKNQVLDALKYKFGISFHADSGKRKNNKVLHKACLLINVTPYSMKNEELRDKSEIDIEFICSKAHTSDEIMEQVRGTARNFCEKYISGLSIE